MFLRNLIYDIINVFIPSLNLKRKKFNFLDIQKKHWACELTENQNDEFAYEWGDPEKSDDFYGNYFFIKERLSSLIKQDTTVIEIGSFSGKWTQYMLNAKKVICVDIIEESFKYLKNKFKNQNNIEYYLTYGNELKGIKSNSVDLIFSMESFARIEKENLKSYFQEFQRVLNKDGKIYIYLPAIEIEYSVYKGFTNINIDEIKKMCRDNNLNIIELDMKIIKHGIMLYATKDNINENNI